MTLRTTWTETRARGPLALAGGVVVFGIVLATLAGGPPSDDVGELFPSMVSSSGAEDGTSRSANALAPSARERLVGWTRTSGDAAGIAADSISNLDAPAEPTSTGTWAAHYRARTLAELETELPMVFGPTGVKIQRVGFLRALAEHGAEASRPGFLAAAAWQGDPDDTRGVSLASFALMQLERRAAEPGYRAILEELAWDPAKGLEPRLRGRAVAYLVRTASAADLPALHGRLYAELDPHVRASAAGAARQRDREIQEALAGLFPDDDLLSWSPPADTGREP